MRNRFVTALAAAFVVVLTGCTPTAPETPDASTTNPVVTASPSASPSETTKTPEPTSTEGQNTQTSPEVAHALSVLNSTVLNADLGELIFIPAPGFTGTQAPQVVYMTTDAAGVTTYEGYDMPVDASYEYSIAYLPIETLVDDNGNPTETITTEQGTFIGPWYGTYDRKGQFGDPWIDTDSNGCRQRDDILARDMTDVVLHDDNCKVLAGVLDDPYTGTTIDFVCGPEALSTGRCASQAAAIVQIDHIIPLRYAMGAGAAGWDQQTRIEFANDPINLLASDGPANGSKSNLGPGDWMPVESYHCTYAMKWTQVLEAYPLRMFPEDIQKLRDVLQTC